MRGRRRTIRRRVDMRVVRSIEEEEEEKEEEEMVVPRDTGTKFPPSRRRALVSALAATMSGCVRWV